MIHGPYDGGMGADVDQIKRDRDFLRDDNMKIQLDVQLNGSVDLIMPVNIPRLLTNIK